MVIRHSIQLHAAECAHAARRGLSHAPRALQQLFPQSGLAGLLLLVPPLKLRSGPQRRPRSRHSQPAHEHGRISLRVFFRRVRGNPALLHVGGPVRGRCKQSSAVRLAAPGCVRGPRNANRGNHRAHIQNVRLHAHLYRVYSGSLQFLSLHKFVV